MLIILRGVNFSKFQLFEGDFACADQVHLGVVDVLDHGREGFFNVDAG